MCRGTRAPSASATRARRLSSQSSKWARTAALAASVSVSVSVSVKSMPLIHS
jgi:hypothetical protein